MISMHKIFEEEKCVWSCKVLKSQFKVWLEKNSPFFFTQQRFDGIFWFVWASFLNTVHWSTFAPLYFKKRAWMKKVLSCVVLEIRHIQLKIQYLTSMHWIIFFCYSNYIVRIHISSLVLILFWTHLKSILFYVNSAAVH